MNTILTAYLAGWLTTSACMTIYAWLVVAGIASAPINILVDVTVTRLKLGRHFWLFYPMMIPIMLWRQILWPRTIWRMIR